MTPLLWEAYSWSFPENTPVGFPVPRSISSSANSGAIRFTRRSRFRLRVAAFRSSLQRLICLSSRNPLIHRIPDTCHPAGPSPIQERASRPPPLLTPVPAVRDTVSGAVSSATSNATSCMAPVYQLVGYHPSLQLSDRFRAFFSESIRLHHHTPEWLDSPSSSVPSMPVTENASLQRQNISPGRTGAVQYPTSVRSSC